MVMVANQSNMTFGYLAGRFPGRIGHLYSPGGQRGPYPWMPYALDNGAYSSFLSGEEWKPDRWRALLRWAALSGQAPLWVLVPDVVKNREATIERWHQYSNEVRAFGFRPAFAAQDGMTVADVPDSECVVFLGGGDEWKDEAIAPWCFALPGRVHVGRVNRWDRLARCWYAGAVSVDGTGWFHKTNGQLGELVKFIDETSPCTAGVQDVSPNESTPENACPVPPSGVQRNSVPRGGIEPPTRGFSVPRSTGQEPSNVVLPERERGGGDVEG